MKDINATCRGLTKEIFSLMRRINRGWIQTYIEEYIVKQESPKQFHFWVAAQTIGAALQRNVWLDRGAYKLYPNMFVFLITESGACRKGAAMRLGLRFLQQVKKVAILYERTSLEGLMVRMDKASETPSKKYIKDGSIFIVADELSDLFGTASYLGDLVSGLTSMYTGARYDFTTRNKGVLSVVNPAPSILAGTTPEHFGKIFPELIKSSGFLGRTILVTGRRERRHAKPEVQHELEEALVEDLLAISDLYGEISLTEDAEEWFENWYNDLPDEPDHGLPAFHERKHDHLLKLALVLSVSDNDEMKIYARHLKAALIILDIVEDGIDSAVRYVGATGESVLGEKVLRFLRTRGGQMDHSSLMRLMYKHIKNSDDFRALIDTMIATDKVAQFIDNKKIYYKLTKEGWRREKIIEGIRIKEKEQTKERRKKK
jgi:hypothetical protein